MGKKRLTGMAMMLLLGILCVTGCSKEITPVPVPVTTDTIEITEDGRIIGYMVETFDKEYYVLGELDAMVREEIAEYNANNQNLSTESGRVPIIVDKVMMAEDGSKNVVVALSFQNAAVYENYMQQELFIGTVKEANEAGYVLEQKVSGVKDGETLTKEQLQKNEEKNILIFTEPISVRLSKEVQFISANAKIDENGFVDCTADEELKYIIYK